MRTVDRVREGHVRFHMRRQYAGRIGGGQ
jgi:hypothetical protein